MSYHSRTLSDKSEWTLLTAETVNCSYLVASQVIKLSVSGYRACKLRRLGYYSIKPSDTNSRTRRWGLTENQGLKEARNRPNNVWPFFPCIAMSYWFRRSLWPKKIRERFSGKKVLPNASDRLRKPRYGLPDRKASGCTCGMRWVELVCCFLWSATIVAAM